MGPRVLLVSLACLGVAACGRPSAPTGTGAAADAMAWFEDVAADVGLGFGHVNGTTGEYLDVEIFSPGVALFDYDNDGDLDVYVVQGQPLGERGADAGPAGTRPRDRLYRNDLIAASDGTRTLTFTDVTEASSIDVRSYGMGVAAGDIDNDGWTDLYLTRLGPNVMLRNNGNGTFTDVTARTGTGDPSWSVSAAFVDVDRDGWLDLFVGNYLAYSVEGDLDCFTPSGEPDYCAPASYRPQPSRLYRNRGNATFVDVTATALRGGEFGPALGVATADFDGDGWIDIYVANDGTENQLWTNRRDGTFENTALLAGVALTADGEPEASMGLDAGDFDNDGDDDLVIANLTSEGTTLYLNAGGGLFEDAGTRSGLRPQSVPYTGFGTAWVDVDNDGWLDVVTVNGAVRRVQSAITVSDPYGLRQRKQLLRNLSNGRFEDVTPSAGPAFAVAEVSRGAAFGDVDNDGDVDVLVGNNGGPLRLLVNRIGSRAHWLGIRAIGAAGRDLLGTRVGVVLADGSTRWRRIRSDGSYASANDPRVLVGLGEATSVTAVRVVWPDGRREEWTDVGVNRWHTLRQGGGR